MKKTLLFLCLISFTLSSNALPNGWVITVYKQPYNNLVSPINATPIAKWDDPNIAIPLGFNHTFHTITTDSLFIDGDNISGGADLSTSLSQTSFFNLFSLTIDVIDRNLDSNNALSSINYKTEIVNGKKITKIEWRDVGLYGDYYADNIAVDSLNFQAWFYEIDSAIEYRFGKSYVVDFTVDFEMDSIPIGIATNFKMVPPGMDYFYYLTQLAPVTYDSIDYNDLINLTNDFGLPDWPQDSTVIRFSRPAPVATNNITKINNQISLYPTLVESNVNIEILEGKNDFKKLLIFSSDGKLVKIENLMKGKNIIDLQYLANQNYILKFIAENEQVIYRITKK